MIQRDNSLLTLTHEENSLLTDLYQLTMVACYAGEDIAHTPASFELFVRHLPEPYGYLMAMGLEQALDYLETLQFSESALESLQRTGIFEDAPSSFWDLLRNGKFEGEVWAVPEGTAIFANEPFLRVEAPLWQAQIVETYLLNIINYQTLIATRAARLRDIAGEQAKLLEFGSRRAFSPQGAIWAARAALAGGLDATSNVIAALKLGQKPSGTMAHSLVMAITALSGEEDEAFQAFHRYFPQATLLIDTYDTVAAAQRLAQLQQDGELDVVGVRLDSGDLAALSQKVRSLLPDVTIYASGDLDEWEIARLQASGASIDGYGLGTRLVTGSPVNGVYKLVEIGDIPTMKESSHKVTYPGRKQIFRTQTATAIESDRLGLADESPNDKETPLLQRVMQDGKRCYEPETLETIAQRSRNTVKRLPNAIKSLDNPQSFPVDISPSLEQLRQSVRQSEGV